MNKTILMGRLTRDPEIRYSSGDEPTAIARYTLAVDRRYKRQGDDQTADFINCVVFGRGAEFAESKAAAAQNENRGSSTGNTTRPAPASDPGDGFMDIPDAIEEELPFN